MHTGIDYYLYIMTLPLKQKFLTPPLIEIVKD